MKPAFPLLTALLLAPLTAHPAVEGAVQFTDLHVLELRERVLHPDDGLLLGNGDLSVSVYQDADRIIWRFGKGDVWDRRLDLSDDPKPAHISEIAHGIKVEGWKCPPYGGPVEATRGTTNPAAHEGALPGRAAELHKRPYPCPKPVGELALHLPADQMGLQITQRLVIEEATLLDHLCLADGRARWRWSASSRRRPTCSSCAGSSTNWNERTRTGHDLPPVRFSLYRWADPPIEAFARTVFRRVPARAPSRAWAIRR